MAGPTEGDPRKTSQFAHIPFEALVPADYNPRQADDAAVDSMCRSILDFGIVDPFVVRAEDRLIVGGHLRERAIRKLLSGSYKRRDEKGRMRIVKWELPKEGVPAVLVYGLDDNRTKLLNLALNRVGGEWDHDKVASLFGDLRESFAKEFGDSVDRIEDALLGSGFSLAEVTDYADLLGAAPDPDAEHPTPLDDKTASLPLVFKNADMRDFAKQKLIDMAGEGRSGDALAKHLGYRPGRGKTAKAAAKRRA